MQVLTKIDGLRVTVEHGNVEKALRKLKKKVQREGVLKELRDREYYEKPTTKRRKEKAANTARYKKKLASENARPKKHY